MWYWLIGSACLALCGHAAFFYGFVFLGLPTWIAWVPSLMLLCFMFLLVERVLHAQALMITALLFPARFLTEMTGKTWEVEQPWGLWKEAFFFGGPYLIPFYLTASLGTPGMEAIGFGMLCYAIQVNTVIGWHTLVPRSIFLYLERVKTMEPKVDNSDLVYDEEDELDQFGNQLPHVYAKLPDGYKERRTLH
jgi:hypothetical protein